MDSETNRSASMIFVMGTSRSGTTMMGRIFGKNATVFTFEEIHFFERVWSPGSAVQVYSHTEAENIFAKLISNQREGYLQEKHPEKYLAEAKKAVADYLAKNTSPQALFAPNLFAHFLSYEGAVNGKQIGCDQTPNNLLYATDIFEYYDNARAIVMVRDPRDVLLSQKGKWKRKFLGAGKNIPWKETIRSYINYHPITISKLWMASNEKVLKLMNHPRAMVIHFEQLIENPEEQIKKACEFLGLEYHENMLRVPQVGSSTGSDNPEALGIKKDNKNKFLKGLDSAEIKICENMTARIRKQYGYENTNISTNYLLLIWYYFSFPFKLALALLFNISRIKNIVDVIKRRL